MWLAEQCPPGLSARFISQPHKPTTSFINHTNQQPHQLYSASREHAEADIRGQRLARQDAKPASAAKPARGSAAKAQPRRGAAAAVAKPHALAEEPAGDDTSASGKVSARRSSSSSGGGASGAGAAHQQGKAAQPAAPQQPPPAGESRLATEGMQPAAAAPQQPHQPSERQLQPAAQQPAAAQALSQQQQQQPPKRRRKLGANRTLPASPDPTEDFPTAVLGGGGGAFGLPRARTSKVGKYFHLLSVQASRPLGIPSLLGF